jgi:uncharacterized C2H2 Zn-finger protein
MDANIKYQCPECETVFRQEHVAERCCPRKAFEVYECNKCDKIFDEESLANECCEEEDDAPTD